VCQTRADLFDRRVGANSDRGQRLAEGARIYHRCRDAENPARVPIYEEYADEAAYKSRLGSSSSGSRFRGSAAGEARARVLRHDRPTRGGA
jgi:hypothetical protein